MMPDKFQNQSDNVDLQARKLLAITPHNDNDLADLPKALYIGTGGTIAIIAADNTTSVSLTVQDGALLPIRAKRVLVTGTTATGIVGLF